MRAGTLDVGQREIYVGHKRVWIPPVKVVYNNLNYNAYEWFLQSPNLYLKVWEWPVRLHCRDSIWGGLGGT